MLWPAGVMWGPQTRRVPSSFELGIDKKSCDSNYSFLSPMNCHL